MKLKKVSLFSGIGGDDIASEKAGIETIGFVEIDRYCQKVLRKHWPNIPIIGDVRNVRRESFNTTVDIVSGGFPCQDLSIAGKRAGLAGERSRLFFEFARIASEIKPRYLVIENVAGMLTSNKGADFAVILYTLDELGYGLAWRVLNSKWCGVPQGRRRVFLVGSLGNQRASEILDRTDGKLLEEMGGRLVSPTFTAAGNTDNSGGSGNNIVIGILKAAGVSTMSGVGYLGIVQDKGADPNGVREADGLSRWLDGVVNGKVGIDGEDKVKGDFLGEGCQEALVAGRLEGLQEELGKAVDRHCLYKIEGGDIPGQLLLALLSRAWEDTDDEQGLVEGEAGKEQPEGLGCDKGLGGKGLVRIEVVGPSEGNRNGGKDKGSSLDKKRYKALGNAIVPQQIYPIYKALVEVDNAYL